MNGVVVSAVAAAAPTTQRLKMYTAADMDEAELQRCTARPRIDFESILSTVRHGGHTCNVRC